MLRDTSSSQSETGCDRRSGRCLESLFSQTAASKAGIPSLQFKSGGSLNSISSSVPAFGSPNFTSFPTTFRNPVYYKWNFEIQHTLGTKTDHFGQLFGHARHSHPDSRRGTECVLSAVCLPDRFCRVALQVAPAAAFGTITQYISAGVASYNGLQISLQQRVAAGLTFNLNYTWSHALDDVSNGGQNEPFNLISTDPSVTFANDPFNLAKQYGNSDYDVKNYFSASVVLNDSLRHMGFKAGPNQIFGGWTVSESNIFWRSGMPFRGGYRQQCGRNTQRL